MSLHRLNERCVWLFRAWKFRLRCERAGIRFVLDQLRPGDVALDLGANKGGFLYWMQRRVGPSGRVVAFEPQPELARYLERLTAEARMRHVTVVHAGVSSELGTMTLIRRDASPAQWASLRKEPPSSPALAEFTTMPVRVVTLDRFLTVAHRPVRLIKCDVEGHELEVFRGARRVLEQDRPLLLFECERRHHGGRSITPVFEYLEGLGYSGAFHHDRRTRPLAEFHPSLQDDPQSAAYANNFVFVPADRESERRDRAA